jgi:alpha-1,3-mannosyl-glycoprotein beta-1,2-N-acetylglucosaminyltransferase
MRLFVTQSEYEDRLAAAIESENHCTSQSRLLIDQISIQQGTIVSLQGAAAHLSLSLSTIIELDWSYLLFIYFMEIISEQNKRQSEECRQLKALLEDLESMFFITYWNFYASSLHSLFRFRSSVCY